MKNKDAAVDELMHMDINQLRAMIVYMSVSIYDELPRALDAMSVPDLVSWWLIHLDYNDEKQAWEPVVNQELDEIANEVAYYGAFG